MSKPSAKAASDARMRKTPANEGKRGKTGELTLEEIAALPDDTIDTTDIAELDEAFWSRARLVKPDRTRLVTLRVKQSVLDAFRARNPKGYQTRMNAVLESYARSVLKA
jgi:uncharacterized protein (DUF4415 family)